MFYTYRSLSGLRLPACIENQNSRESADQKLVQWMSAGEQVTEITPAFTSREEVKAEVAEYRRRLNCIPKSLDIVRRALVIRLVQLRRELREWWS